MLAIMIIIVEVEKPFKLDWRNIFVAKDNFNVMDIEISLALMAIIVKKVSLFSKIGCTSMIEKHKVREMFHCMASKQIRVFIKASFLEKI